ncbi:acyl-CoA dehydrogenase family protein [Rhodococcoides fascians]|uniref:acyl-CoA dehydrogenase family protein n=1 Tax=Rhodococcoides fascians TaxID=1828 RepID=UPI00068C58DD|nr:acyl-CoA dehydrogenase family protein [Rhodococcus fascians]
MSTTEGDGPFDPNADRDALREAVRDYCERHWTEARVRAAIDDAASVPARAWSALGAELGLLGLAVPEDQGGSGASTIELAIVAEEFGRALVPLPWLSSVIAAELLSAAGDTELVRRICDAEVTCALIGPTDGSWRADTASVRADRDGDAWALSGTAHHVVDGVDADTYVVLADADGQGIFVVDASTAGVDVTPSATMDPTRRQATVSFDGARARRVGDGSSVIGAVVSLAAVLVAAESVGVAARMLDLAVDYAGSRVQFGRKIGSFQAVKHRCADMFVDLEEARSATTYAAWAVSSGRDGSGRDDAVLTSTLAHVSATGAAQSITADAVQVFGGIAITWEHPAHLYYKRAVVDAVLWGGAQHRERLAVRALDSGLAQARTENTARPENTNEKVAI